MRTHTDSLCLDFYQLTMLQGYLAAGLNQTAVFEFFVRALPPHRNFLVAAGLEELLNDLQELRFTRADLEWLSEQESLDHRLIECLRSFKFTGDVHALPEGTIFFPNEPVLRITAPLPQAQLIESLVINRLHFQTLIASKAIRYVLVAPQRQLVDFGMRRAHGLESGLLAARSGYLAGFAGTSNMAAGRHYGIPTYGTMAHSFVESHDSERQAFLNFALANPENAVLIVDTYDTASAVENLPHVAASLRKHGILIKGVRIDSGDLLNSARQVRQILDQAGLKSVRIFASGGLDEFTIRDLTDSDAPIDGFGIGTNLTTSADAPSLNCAYKLQSFAGRPRRKQSEGKATWPGVKQVFRQFTSEGIMECDTVTRESDRLATGSPLLTHYMANGRRIGSPPTLNETRNHLRSEIERLPASLKTIDHAPGYPVRISRQLRELTNRMDENRRTSDQAQKLNIPAWDAEVQFELEIKLEPMEVCS